jgi:hypothetical protein
MVEIPMVEIRKEYTKCTDEHRKEIKTEKDDKKNSRGLREKF